MRGRLTITVLLALAAPAGAQPPEWPSDVQGKNLPEWLADTSSPDPAVRQNAVQLLPYFGPDARKPALPALVRLSTDSDPGVRIATFGAIGAFAFDSEADQRRVFEAMRATVNNSAPGAATRQAALRAFAAYGPDAGIALPILDPLRLDPSWETRLALATTLGRIGSAVYDANPSTDTSGRPVPAKPGYDGTFKTLKYLLENDKCAAVRLEAAYSFLSVGAPKNESPVDYIRAVGPYLEMVGNQLAREKDKTVLIWLHVLRVMYDDRSFAVTLPKIAGYLHQPELAVRAQALNAVGVMGPRAIGLLPDVRDCLKQYQEPIMLAGALACLRGMGKDAAGVIPDVEEFRDKTTNEELKKVAADTIDALKGVKKAGVLPGAVKP